MANINRSTETWEIADLLKRINQGDDPKLLRQKAFQLAKKVDPSDIVAAEQTLIDEGYSSQIAKQLSATFILISLHREDDNSRNNLPHDHILRKIKVEHELARCFLADLNNVAEAILDLNCLGAPTEGAVRATAIGLLHRQKKVTVLVDAIGSLNKGSGKIALRSMRVKGARLTDTKVFLSHSSLHLARACR